MRKTYHFNKNTKYNFQIFKSAHFQIIYLKCVNHVILINSCVTHLILEILIFVTLLFAKKTK